jgi:hypothetical protein
VDERRTEEERSKAWPNSTSMCVRLRRNSFGFTCMGWEEMGWGGMG